MILTLIQIMEDEISERLDQIIKAVYGRKKFTEICRMHNLNYAVLRKVKAGERKMGIDSLMKFVQIAPNMNLNWVLLGEGDMFRKPNPNDLLEPKNELENINLNINGLDIPKIMSDFNDILLKYKQMDTK